MVLLDLLFFFISILMVLLMFVMLLIVESFLVFVCDMWLLKFFGLVIIEVGIGFVVRMILVILLLRGVGLFFDNIGKLFCVCKCCFWFLLLVFIFDLFCVFS